MRRFMLSAALLAAATMPGFAQSDGGGDREPAGGAFMSSYSRNPYEGDRRFPSVARPNYAGSDVDEPVATGSIGSTEARRRRR